MTGLAIPSGPAVGSAISTASNTNGYTSGYTSGGMATQYYAINGAAASAFSQGYVVYTGSSDTIKVVVDLANRIAGKCIVNLGSSAEIELPDGSIITINADGNYHIDDKDAKVVYQASRIREFSPHLNASDMLANFIKYVGSLGVKQGELLELPLGLFINWLVIEAAEAYKDPIPHDVTPVKQHPLLKKRISPRCLYCQRFISKTFTTHGFHYCDGNHATAYFEKLKQVA